MNSVGVSPTFLLQTQQKPICSISDSALNSIFVISLQIMLDEAKFVLFSVFDENRSWYLQKNIKEFCADATNVNPKDPEFYASNIMHSE